MKSVFTTALIALTLCFSVNTSSAQQPTTALEFNDYLVKITDSLFVMGQGWGRKFNEVNQTKKYSELTASRKQMETYILAKQALVRKLKDVAGSEELKKAQLDFLAVELSLVKEAFLPLEKLTASSTNAEVQAALAKVREGAERENKMLQIVVAAQEAYAKKNGFRIAGATEETED